MRIDPVRMLLPFQFAVVAGGIVLLAVAPPAHGRMLLLPVLPGSSAHLAADVVDRGAHIIARGPVSGSIVVSGDRDPVTRGLLFRGVLTIAAPDFLCGGKDKNPTS